MHQEFRKLYSLYVHIYILCIIISKKSFLTFFFCTQSYQIVLKGSIRPINGTLTGTNTPGQSGPSNNINEELLHTR